MKRTPLKRKTPLRRRSAKTADLYEREGGRRDVVASLISCKACEAGPRIGSFLCDDSERASSTKPRSTDPVWSECWRTGDHVHEVIPRSAGGSILDGPNLLVVCAMCHRWIHDHPKDSRSIGLLSSGTRKK